MDVGLEDSLPDGGVGMNKEMLKQADEWLKSMLEIASVQKEADMIEHMKERIKVQKWLMEQAKRVKELESESYNAHLERLLNRREQQNKRYREFIETVSDNWLIAEKIKIEVEGIHIITPHHLFNWINKEANKLLEE